MMFINVMNEDIFDVTFSIYLDNQIIRQWRMQRRDHSQRLNLFKLFNKLLLNHNL